MESQVVEMLPAIKKTPNLCGLTQYMFFLTHLRTWGGILCGSFHVVIQGPRLLTAVGLPSPGASDASAGSSAAGRWLTEERET